MKVVKTIGIGISLLILLLLVWFNLPFQLKYYEEIKAGNEFVKNIREYQVAYKMLPTEGDWNTLSKLNPLTKNTGYTMDNFNPDYRIIGFDQFKLTFLEGFDGPYLTYDSNTDRWKMSFQ
jgi:hypothetical protein